MLRDAGFRGARPRLPRSALALPSAAAGRFIDKMPLNYLYCGLIRRALPDAQIVHVTRHPMAVVLRHVQDACSRMAIRFPTISTRSRGTTSAYRRLMDHWQSTMPGRRP